MIKFKKTKRAELRTNTKDIGELAKVVGQLISIVKSQQKQVDTLQLRVNEFKTTFNKHRHRSGGTGYDTRGPIEQVFVE